MNNPTFSVIGLGKLGACWAATIASRGFPVIGVDLNPRVVEAVNAGKLPTIEPQLEELLASNRSHLRATSSYCEAVLNSDVTFIVVPTPTDARGAFSLDHVAAAFHEIGRALAEKPSYHIVVLVSTVLPGSTRLGLLPILERECGKVAGRDFGLCYAPEFVALGSVVRNLLYPDLVVIGEFDERCGKELEPCYASIVINNAPIRRMSLENAELVKIALNNYVTMKITFANHLADLCERIPGGDVDEVTGALGLDTRIGPKYLKGGMGYGGPCLPRDTLAMEFLAKSCGLEAPFAKAADSYNRSRIKRIAQFLLGFVNPDSIVALLGLAYKPLTPVIEESQGVDLANLLAEARLRVVAFDPLANDVGRAELDSRVTVLDSLEECLAQSNTVLITTPDPAFKTLTAASFANASEVTVVDFWRILDKELVGHSSIRYIPIGHSADDESNAARLAALWGGISQRVTQDIL